MSNLRINGKQMYPTKNNQLTTEDIPHQPTNLADYLRNNDRNVQELLRRVARLEQHWRELQQPTSPSNKSDKCSERQKSVGLGKPVPSESFATILAKINSDSSSKI